MTKKLLTKEIVSQAKQELEAAGEKVTSKSVRDHLGFGSYKTAKDLLEELHAEENAFEPAPDEVRAALTQSADRMWAVARAKAAEAYQAQEALLTTRATEAEALAAERLEVIVELEETQAKLEADQARLHRALAEEKARYEKMRSRLSEKDKELAKEKTKNDTLQELIGPAFGAKVRRNRTGPTATGPA